jgi:glutamyl-Q tRNA(Asp) synthetase
VVDDAAQGVTDVVRGADLASSVPWQTAIQKLLGLPEPRYLHLPVLTDADGTKLSKRDHAAPLADDQAKTAIRQALGWLRQPQPPNSLTIPEMIRWAAENWQPQRFAGVESVAYR